MLWKASCSLSLYRLVCKYLYRHIDAQAIPGSIRKVLRLQGTAPPLPVGVRAPWAPWWSPSPARESNQVSGSADARAPHCEQVHSPGREAVHTAALRKLSLAVEGRHPPCAARTGWAAGGGARTQGHLCAPSTRGGPGAQMASVNVCRVSP